MASLAEHFLLVCMFLLPRLSFAQRGVHTTRDGKHIERVQARYTDFSRGELNDKWLPQKEPDGFNILFDALKNWRPSSSTNFVKVQYQDGRRYSVSSNEASYVVPYNPKRNVCPKFPTRPSCSSYSQSTCWSPGVPDVDCPNHGLCCFNGCSNVCIPQNKPPLRKGTRPSRRPTNPTQPTGHFNIADAAPAPSNKPKLSYNNIFNTYQTQSAVITTTTRKPHTTHPTDEKYDYNEPAQIQSPDSNPNQDDPNKCSLIDPKPASMCFDKKANCWSAGVLDLDCPNSGLCCFDGCVNSCVDMPNESYNQDSIKDEADATYADLSQDTDIYSDNQSDPLDEPVQQEETYPDSIQDTPSDNPYKCPSIGPQPSYSCVNKKANCWSPGVSDLDCPNSGLCCFDGCVNTCVDMEDEALSQSNPDPSEDTFSVPASDPADEVYSDNPYQCPAIVAEPSHSCANKKANCWSPGVLDLDCPSSGLCCFDGCVNTCVDMEDEPLSQSNFDPSEETFSVPASYPADEIYSDNPYQCPAIDPKPSHSCVNKKANCWSPGVSDLDCPNSGLCCFDGCVNTCVDMEDEALSQSNPDTSEETFSVPASDPADEIYSDNPNQCPAIDPKPSYSCVNKKANCWSPGVSDLDCPNSGLCCFDGCVNTCVDMEDEALSQSNPDPSEETFSVPASDPADEIYSDNPYQCPAIAAEPSQSCANKKANCWSAGVLDLDCPDYGLCCFDGCVNSCVDEVKESASQSSAQPNDQKLSENIPELADNTPDYSDNIDSNPIIPHDPDKCPFLTPKPTSSCANRIANCWSVGVPDLDCPDYGLCCYDGCVNSCIDMKKETASESSPDPAQDTSLYSDNPQDNSEQPNQTYLDPPQETPSYSDNPDKCTFATPKPANSCLDKKANCWSAGVLDLDCPNSGLCCFDGCVNTCVDMKNEAQIQGNPDSSKQTFSAPVQVPGDEIYDVSLTESLDDNDPEEIDEYSPYNDSYGSPTADPVEFNAGGYSHSSSTETKKSSVEKFHDFTQTLYTPEDIFAGPFQDTNTHSDNPTHGANINTINDLQITNITENEPSDVANSDEFVFPLSSSADPIQNTIMLLLDRYGPPKTSQLKPSDYEPAKLDNSAYNPHIDSYGSPTADPVNIVTAESSHFSSTTNSEDNNDIDQYQLTNYDSGSTAPNTEKDRYSVPNLDKVTPIKTSYIKPTVKPVKLKVPSSHPQQTEYTKYTNPVNYGLKLSHTKLQNPRKYKPKKILNYASIDGYGSPLADPIRDIEKLVNTRKSAYLKPIQTGLRPVGKPNSQFSPIFYESVRLTTPRSNIYRSKDKYVKKILKKKYMKSSNKQQIKKPSEQKSSLGKFWERHFGFFPILEQPTSKPSTVRPSSCPEVQSRSSEDCKLNYQNYCTKLGKHDRLCPYDDICCYDGCANRCLNWKPPQNVFFRDSVGVFVQ